MIKKIIVTDFNKEGRLGIKCTMTTKKAIIANDFDQAKKLVAQMIQMHTLKLKRFTVEWTRDGNPEGYMVAKAELLPVK